MRFELTRPLGQALFDRAAAAIIRLGHPDVSDHCGVEKDRLFLKTEKPLTWESEAGGSLEVALAERTQPEDAGDGLIGRPRDSLLL